MTCVVASASAISAASASIRADGVPSSSPSLKVPRLPRSTTPGAITSAPKLTQAWTTRPGPAAAASAGEGSPFCSAATNPSPASRPASSAATAAVWCCLHATRTGKSILSGSSPGPIAAGRAVNCSTGPSTRSPSALIAATTAGSASQIRTSWPSRTSPAATVPPIAPQPSTRYLMGRNIRGLKLHDRKSKHLSRDRSRHPDESHVQCWAKVCANLCPPALTHGRVPLPRHALATKPSLRRSPELPVRHKSVLTAALTAGCALAVLAGCGSGGSSSAASSAGGTTSSGSASAGTPVAGGNLVFANPQDAESLNQTNIFDNNSIWIIEQITQPLFTVTSNGKGVMP